MYCSTHSLTSALDGGEWSASRPSRLNPSERAPGTHWIGDWVGPRAVLDAVVKRKIPSPRREWNPRTSIVQSVAQRYTDWAIMAVQNYTGYFVNIRAIFPGQPSLVERMLRPLMILLVVRMSIHSSHPTSHANSHARLARIMNPEKWLPELSEIG
jgi:hypothetical protein